MRNNGGREITAGNLNDELKESAKSGGVKWPFSNGKALAQKLRNLKSTLVDLVVINQRHDSNLKQAMYSFKLKNDAGIESDSVAIPASIPEPQTSINTDITPTSRNHRNHITTIKNNKKGNNKEGWLIRFRRFLEGMRKSDNDA